MSHATFVPGFLASRTPSAPNRLPATELFVLHSTSPCPDRSGSGTRHKHGAHTTLKAWCTHDGPQKYLVCRFISAKTNSIWIVHNSLASWTGLAQNGSEWTTSTDHQNTKPHQVLVLASYCMVW